MVGEVLAVDDVVSHVEGGASQVAETAPSTRTPCVLTFIPGAEICSWPRSFFESLVHWASSVEAFSFASPLPVRCSTSLAGVQRHHQPFSIHALRHVHGLQRPVGILFFFLMTHKRVLQSAAGVTGRGISDGHPSSPIGFEIQV